MFFFISGKVKKSLTIDPTVWIFDERKIDLDAFFLAGANLPEENDLTDYTRKISAQFDREMLEALSRLIQTEIQIVLNTIGRN
ncbi:hypothetical protein [Bacillus sp. JCM 19041]|uniref:hypothetical protein n=1 Tax=Bacillus sp. JCM 19041 TaxID=1460637 RepID=UPI000A7DF7CD